MQILFQYYPILFLDDPMPDCPDSGDTNDDGKIDISDAIFDLLYLFSGKEIPPPGHKCGIDLTVDNLTDCNYSNCISTRS